MSCGRSRRAGHVQADAGDAVVEVAAEAAAGDIGFEVAVGGGDDAHIHRHRARAAHRADLAFLQGTQQLDLEGRRGVADLVEEQRAAVGLLKEADAVFVGAGEGTLLVAEEFASSRVSGRRRSSRRRRRARRGRWKSGWRAPAVPCRCPTRR
jgi:hypothetical protein